jgi:hypothetical protein
VAAVGLDLRGLLADVEDRLVIAETIAASSPIQGPRRASEPARPAVPIEPPTLTRSAR